MKRTVGLIALIILFAVTSCIQFPTDVAPDLTTPNAPLQKVPPYLRVTYIVEGNVWIWRDDTRVNTQLSFDGNATDVTISTDGELVVYIRDGELYSVDAGGGNLPKLLISNKYLSALLPIGYSDYHIHQFDIAPDNHTVYFSITINSGSGGNDLFKIDTNTQVPVNVLPPGQGGNFHFSPDGQCIAIARSNELLMRCGNAQPNSIFTFPRECGFGADNGPEIVWKLDSSGFYIVTPKLTDDRRNILVRQDYWFIPVSGAPKLQTHFMSWLFDPTFISPDGSKVAYYLDRGDVITLHVIEQSGSDTPYFSFSRAEMGFLNWNPNSKDMVIWLTNSLIPRWNLPADTLRQNSQWKPILSEHAAYAPVEVEDESDFPRDLIISDLRWVDEKNVIFIRNGVLTVEHIDGSSVSIQAGVGHNMHGPGPDFDFPHIP